jgi:hypothetical protein
MQFIHDSWRERSRKGCYMKVPRESVLRNMREGLLCFPSLLAETLVTCSETSGEGEI